MGYTHLVPSSVLSTSHAWMHANLTAASGFLYVVLSLYVRKLRPERSRSNIYKGHRTDKRARLWFQSASFMSISLSVTLRWMHIHKYHNFKNPGQRENSIRPVIGWKQRQCYYNHRNIGLFCCGGTLLWWISCRKSHFLLLGSVEKIQTL